MCGIFGFFGNIRQTVSADVFQRMSDTLFLFAESRGKEAAGVITFSDTEIGVYKEAQSASAFILSPTYKKLLNTVPATGGMIGHARLVTNGSLEDNRNNQPVIKDGMVGVHNGIVTNVESLWQTAAVSPRLSEVDTEIIFGLYAAAVQSGLAPAQALKETFDAIEGSASIAFVSQDHNQVLLCTNTGSLYVAVQPKKKLVLFASEAYMLRRICALPWVQKNLGIFTRLPHVAKGGWIVDSKSGSTTPLAWSETEATSAPSLTQKKTLIDFSVYAAAPVSKAVSATTLAAKHDTRAVNTWVQTLKRCTRCILPETVPFLSFDAAGMCNYCRDYVPMPLKSKEELSTVLKKNTKGEVDCLVSFSGGRDSCFGLHYIKEVLGLTAVAYTYDWGMITDLGRRNQARLCGKLGVEHILVSADIKRKRENIKKNVAAWLDVPDLGTVPLFMAGDKQYFYYAYQVKKQVEAPVVVMCENMLEHTGFKTGFSGIDPHNRSRHAYHLGLRDKIGIAAYYAKQSLQNPRYLNSSVLDTLFAYASYYLYPHKYVNLFQYIPWREEEVVETIDAYRWERSSDTPATWRIGDGTAAVYNLIYYSFVGFTENDTFRSNQIREGMLSRAEALRLCEQENQPRFESLSWYFDVINLPADAAIATIDRTARAYRTTYDTHR